MGFGLPGGSLHARNEKLQIPDVYRRIEAVERHLTHRRFVSFSEQDVPSATALLTPTHRRPPTGERPELRKCQVPEASCQHRGEGARLFWC